MSSGKQSIGIILGIVLGLGAVGAGAWFWQQNTRDDADTKPKVKENRIGCYDCQIPPEDTIALSSAQVRQFLGWR